MHVPEELTDFWRELKNAELRSDGKVLKLARGTSFLGNRRWGDRMLVRECYRRLTAKLEQDFRAGEGGRVIIGTPGMTLG